MRRLLGTLALLALALLWPACSTPSVPSGPPEASRELPAQPVTLNAQVLGAHFIVEVPRPRREPWRFLVDTGSSVTLVSAEVARRHGASQRRFTHAPKRVRAATGAEAEFDAITLRELKFGEAVFRNQPALVFDPSELSQHLGVRIDGILGFSFFQNTLLTLDYGASRLTLAPPPSSPLSDALPYTERYRTPRTLVRLGELELEALIDTGSDSALVLPGPDQRLTYLIPPRAGGTVGGLIGSVTSQVARLASPLELGALHFPTPAVTLGATHLAVGAELFRDLVITFDTSRQHWRVTPPPSGALPAPRPVRHCGVSFEKTPAYWRIESVLPGTPAEGLGLRAGDVVVRIEGEPVSQWPLRRFLAWVEEHPQVVFTLLHGSRETPVVVPIHTLLPLTPPASPAAL